MSRGAELPRWGTLSRRTFQYVASPLPALHLLLGVVSREGYRSFLDRHGLLAPAVALTTVVVAFVVSGCLWLVAEFRTGRREPEPLD